MMGSHGQTLLWPKRWQHPGHPVRVQISLGFSFAALPYPSMFSLSAINDPQYGQVKNRGGKLKVALSLKPFDKKKIVFNYQRQFSSVVREKKKNKTIFSVLCVLYFITRQLFLLPSHSSLCNKITLLSSVVFSLMLRNVCCPLRL